MIGQWNDIFGQGNPTWHPINGCYCPQKEFIIVHGVMILVCVFVEGEVEGRSFFLGEIKSICDTN